ncbi:MAG: ABC transporter permease [Candidatus Bathyarchaeota archaeon]|nr:ABC transporter permease [Candidatus Bathyarchaeota archaeon]
MKPGDILASAWDSVRSRKFRFALNLIGILIGCAAVTGLVSITQGLSDSVSGQLQIFGPQNIMVIPGGLSSGTMTTGKLTYKDLTAIENVEYISAATPIIANNLATYTVKGKTYRASVYGLDENFQKLNTSFELADGRAMVRSDNGVVIIGANIAWPQDSDGPILGMGDRITLTTRVGDVQKTLTVRVIGVLTKQGSTFGINLDDAVALTLRDAQQLYETGNTYSYVMAQANSVENVAPAAAAIKAKLGKGYSAVTYESAKATMDQVLGSIQAVLGGIAAISLVVAGVGIINTMTISVMERTREIGVMKAIGSKSMDVMLMFISEAILTGFIGGIMGVLLGFALSGVVGSFIGISSIPSVMNGALVVGFAVLTTTLSGLYPAWRAANLNPVEALRSE